MKKLISIIIGMCLLLTSCGSAEDDEKYTDKSQIENEEKISTDEANGTKSTDEKSDETKNNESETEEKVSSINIYDNEKVPSEEVTYRNYTNARYGFSIDYPDFLEPGTPPDNGDGLRFHDKTDEVELVATGWENFSYESLDELYNDKLNSVNNISYKTKGKNFFVVSWEEDNNILYEYRIVGETYVNGFIIKYPQEREKEFDSIVTKIYKSFRPGKLY